MGVRVPPSAPGQRPLAHPAGDLKAQTERVPEQLVDDGETVVALGSYRWKHKSSGEPAAVKMVHVWTMNGGKAVAFQQHVDTVKVRELS